MRPSNRGFALMNADRTRPAKIRARARPSVCEESRQGTTSSLPTERIPLGETSRHGTILACEESRQGTTLVAPKALPFPCHHEGALAPEGSALATGGAHEIF